MNIWRDICIRALENGQLDSIKRHIKSDVDSAGCIGDIRDMLEEWISDIYDIEEAINGSCDD